VQIEDESDLVGKESGALRPTHTHQLALTAYNTQKNKENGSLHKKKRQKQLTRVHKALNNGESLLFEEEVRFIQLCCRIMKVSESDKVKFITANAVIEEGNPGFAIATIKKILEALGSEAKACRRASPAHYQASRNADDMDAPMRSLEYLGESAQSLQEALQQGFIMGIRMARFNMTKSMKDYRVTLERVAMTAMYCRIAILKSGIQRLSSMRRVTQRSE
jgi:hypothetical protein